MHQEPKIPKSYARTHQLVQQTQQGRAQVRGGFEIHAMQYSFADVQDCLHHDFRHANAEAHAAGCPGLQGHPERILVSCRQVHQ